MSKVVVAMSGGVDSSVAALLLKQQQEEIIGVSMQVWDYRRSGGCSSRATCCAPDDFTDARMVAAKIGIPYYVFDLEKEFQSAVIDRFVSDYLAGKTPNPCVECNNKVKFFELRNRSKAIGCSKVATGHYAQIKEEGGARRLLRGADRSKDQSYFLYGLKNRELAETLFPVGHLTKPEVRELAREFGLVTADKPESQDICFVSGSAAEFVTRIGGSKKGAVKLVSGETVGQHDGIHNYTVGQRRGIGLSGTQEPMYVVSIDSSDNTVIVGPRQSLDSRVFSVKDCNWLVGVSEDSHALVQLRYRTKPLPCRFVKITAEMVTAELEEGGVVTPGQSAVFYNLTDEYVLGGGIIL